GSPGSSGAQTGMNVMPRHAATLSVGTAATGWSLPRVPISPYRETEAGQQRCQKGRRRSQPSRARCSVVLASWTMNCRLQCAALWSGRVREGVDVLSVPEPNLNTARPANDPSLICLDSVLA